MTVYSHAFFNHSKNKDTIERATESMINYLNQMSQLVTRLSSVEKKGPVALRPDLTTSLPFHRHFILR